MPVTAVSEERGEVPIAGGGPARVVIDPVDGSLNAKRGVPFSAVSIAVASGAAWATWRSGGWPSWLLRARGRRAGRGPGLVGGAGRGSVSGGERSRLEPGPSRSSAWRPLARRCPARRLLSQLEARRIRALGSVALTLCHVAAGHLDAMISLRPVRSVDVAAAQLIVTECGGAVAFPGGDTLDLSMRSHGRPRGTGDGGAAGGGAPAGLSSARACAPVGLRSGRRESLPE